MTLIHKVGMWAVIGVALTSAIALSYQHYSSLVDSKVELSREVEALKSEVVKQTSKAEAYALSIAKWDEAAQLQAKALEDNTQAQARAGQESRELKNVLSRHNLEDLALKKPGLIERRANAATARVFRLLERASADTPVD